MILFVTTQSFNKCDFLLILHERYCVIVVFVLLKKIKAGQREKDKLTDFFLNPSRPNFFCFQVQFFRCPKEEL